VDEIRAILGDLGIRLRALSEFPGAPQVREDGTTYEENALKKARAAAAFTHKPALADDTGLEVDALGGRPGIYAARFAGEGCSFEDNINKLLELLKGVPPERRGARFISVVALVTSDGREELVKGELRGWITETPSGRGGFGFDPVFRPADVGKTLAELDPDAKNRISHRRRALEKARSLLQRETIGA
jgi:XTP/dITP diphosphohydrolase